PHERDPRVPLRPALGRAGGALGGELDPEGRRGVSRARSQGAGAAGDRVVSPGARERGTREPEGGKSPGGGGAADLSGSELAPQRLTPRIAAPGSALGG